MKQWAYCAKFVGGKWVGAHENKQPQKRSKHPNSNKTISIVFTSNSNTISDTQWPLKSSQVELKHAEGCRTLNTDLLERTDAEKPEERSTAPHSSASTLRNSWNPQKQSTRSQARWRTRENLKSNLLKSKHAEEAEEPSRKIYSNPSTLRNPEDRQ